MKPTMDELVKTMMARVAEIEASKAPDLPEDIAAYQRWKGELDAMAVRLGRLAEEAETPLAPRDRAQAELSELGIRLDTVDDMLASPQKWLDGYRDAM